MGSELGSGVGGGVLMNLRPQGRETEQKGGSQWGTDTWGSSTDQERGLGGAVETDHKANPKTELLIPLQGGFDSSSKTTFPRGIPGGTIDPRGPLLLRPSPQSPLH